MLISIFFVHLESFLNRKTFIMSGYEYFKDTLTNRYAQFFGRARRSEYWYFALFNWLAVVAVSAISHFLLSTWLATGVTSLISVLLFIPSLAVLVRRLHDTGRSGWWLLMVFIPILGLIVLLYFLVSDSDEGMNDYGPNPKNEFDDRDDDNFV